MGNILNSGALQFIVIIIIIYYHSRNGLVFMCTPTALRFSIDLHLIAINKNTGALICGL